MRVDLKGIQRRSATLADGTTKVYWYAWRGGPKLRGQPGTPEFIASYNEAVAQRVPAPEGKLQSLLDAYQQSQKFLSRRERTRSDYVKRIMTIEAEFGDFPLKALAARETRGVFMDWRDRLALRSVRRRLRLDRAALVLAWAKDRGKITVNPCEKGGRLYEGTRVDSIWTVEDEAAFLKARQRTCTCRSCWRYGRDSGKAICLPCRGRPMTARISACASPRRACAS